MKGFVPTPTHVVDQMVERLFLRKPPSSRDTVLDPGCGEGAFIDGVIRWCRNTGNAIPRLVGIDSDPKRVRVARTKFSSISHVKIWQQDFLSGSRVKYDYIIGNPPYVSITKLSESEKSAFRKSYQSARGRFDLYLLFFEQALKCLQPDGRLVFITPEKFLYVDTASPLREMLTNLTIEEISLIDEETFSPLVTYPAITTVRNQSRRMATKVLLRNGDARRVHFRSGKSWLPLILGDNRNGAAYRLKDICLRISCGVATGSDSVFVTKDVPSPLKKFAWPTIAGHQIRPDSLPVSDNYLLIPYDRNGNLLRENALGELKEFLREPNRYVTLLARTCVSRKPWYAFHENPPLPDIFRPKILCKDIISKPYFVIDRTGEFVPRHSVYYIVPRESSHIDSIAEYLNSAEAASWLQSHCQRAANGFLRLQSQILKEIPLPAELGRGSDGSRVKNLPLTFPTITDAQSI